MDVSHLIVIAMLSISILACNNEKLASTEVLNQDDTCKEIKVNHDLDVYHDKPFLINPSFVKLETTKESLIGFTSKLIISNDLIFVLDNRIAKALFVFNKDGKFLYKIRNIGKGPGEILDIRDFDIRNNTIYILDFNKILKYNLQGEFLNERNTSWPASNIKVTNNEDYYLFVNAHLSREEFTDYHIVKENYKKNVPTQKYVKPFRKEITKGDRFQYVDGKIVFSAPQYGEYKIYEFSDDKEMCLFEFDFFERNFSSGIRNEPTTLKILGKTDKKNILSDTYIGEGFLFFTLRAMKRIYTGVYSLENSTFSVGRVFHEIPIDDFTFPFACFVNGKTISFPIEANIINSFTAIPNEQVNEYAQESYKALMRFGDIKSTDNPIIANYHVSLLN
jgi:hypothetical protein